MAVDVEERWVTDDAVKLTFEVHLKYVSIYLGVGRSADIPDNLSGSV
jgi:hypothetical protein